MRLKKMPSPSPIPLQVSGYHVLSLSLPPLPSYPTCATHYLYIANHHPKISTPTAPRTLFLVNVPFDATDMHIKHLFSTQLGLPRGRIEDVYFEGERRKTEDHNLVVLNLPNELKRTKKRKRSAKEKSADQMEDTNLPLTWDRKLHGPGRTAEVKLVDRASMEAVIKAVKKARKDGTEPTWGEAVEAALPALGLPSMRCTSAAFGVALLIYKGYLNHHKLRYPDKAQLLESVDAYMTGFAAQETAQARLQAKQRQEPDKDGFVMVTRGGRNGPAKQEVAQEQAYKQKEKRKGLEDFYRFQTREKKKARAGELVRKFEEDKEKVRRMREKKGRFEVYL